MDDPVQSKIMGLQARLADEQKARANLQRKLQNLGEMHQALEDYKVHLSSTQKAKLDAEQRLQDVKPELERQRQAREDAQRGLRSKRQHLEELTSRMETATEKIHVARKYAATRAEFTSELQKEQYALEEENKAVEFLKRQKTDNEDLITKLELQISLDDKNKTKIDSDMNSNELKDKEYSSKLDALIKDMEKQKNDIKDDQHSVTELERKIELEREYMEKQEARNHDSGMDLKKVKLLKKEKDEDLSRVNVRNKTLDADKIKVQKEIDELKKKLIKAEAELKAKLAKQPATTTKSKEPMASSVDRFSLS